MIDAPEMMFDTMMGPINAIAQDQAGIGYSVYYYVMFINRDEQLKLAAIEGVLPTATTIGNEDYPLTTEVYAVIRADIPSNSPAVLLRDWLLTETVQATIAESGYVPIQPGP